MTYVSIVSTGLIRYYNELLPEIDVLVIEQNGEKEIHELQTA